MGWLVSISAWTGSMELVNDRWEAHPCGRSRLHWSAFFSLFFFFSSLVISGRPRSWEIDKKSSKQIENKLFTKCYSVNFYFKRTSEIKSKEDFDSFLAPTLKPRLLDNNEKIGVRELQTGCWDIAAWLRVKNHYWWIVISEPCAVISIWPGLPARSMELLLKYLSFVPTLYDCR